MGLQHRGLPVLQSFRTVKKPPNSNVDNGGEEANVMEVGKFRPRLRSVPRPVVQTGSDEAFLKTAISHCKKQRNFPAEYLHDIPIVKYMTGFFAAHF
jgi:hypothetical protein